MQEILLEQENLEYRLISHNFALPTGGPEITEIIEGRWLNV